jgi:hypothetical protein
MGLNYSLLLSFLVGISVIVPYVGAISATIPVAFIAYFQWGFAADFWWILLVYQIIQLLDGNVLVPVLFSEVVNLHPVAIIVAVLFFGGLWGVWGVFFAIPLATLVQAVLNAWPRVQPPPDEADADGRLEGEVGSERRRGKGRVRTRVSGSDWTKSAMSLSPDVETGARRRALAAGRSVRQAAGCCRPGDWLHRRDGTGQAAVWTRTRRPAPPGAVIRPRRSSPR